MGLGSDVILHLRHTITDHTWMIECLEPTGHCTDQRGHERSAADVTARLLSLGPIYGTSVDVVAPRPRPIDGDGRPRTDLLRPCLAARSSVETMKALLKGWFALQLTVALTSRMHMTNR